MSGAYPSVEDLNRTERGVRGNTSYLTTFELGNQFFPAFGLEMKHWFFLDLETISPWTGATVDFFFFFIVLFIYWLCWVFTAVQAFL